MSEPLVSIVIPCHNSAAWLPETLESALAQTWTRREIILVDDGSTDDSAAIARRYEARGVRVIAQTNAGAAAARNRGLAEANGDFLQFLDADDLLAPDKIEHQVRLLAARGPDQLATCRWGRFSGDPADARFAPDALWRDLSPVDWIVTAFERNLMMATATWLVPRRLADAAGRWDTTHRINPIDDMDYFDRVRAASAGVAFCAETCTYYRSAVAGSLSGIRSPEAWRAILDTLVRSTDLLRRLEDSPRTRHAAATVFQRFVYEIFPAHPEMAAEASRRAAALGGSRLQPEGGSFFRLAARLLGWRTARRLQRLRR